MLLGVIDSGIPEIMFPSKKVNLAIFFTVFIFHQCIGSPTSLRYGQLDARIPNQKDLKISTNVADDNQEWCDPVLGCLEMTDDWKGPNRPINLMPDSRAHINTRFYLHTRAEPNTDTNYEVSADDLTSLAKSPFDATKPTKFIIHGYIDSGNARWMKEMAAELLAYGDYNVLRVNWVHGSRQMYAQSAANTRVVGLEISHFVNTLVTTWKLDPADVHCIGHSLGSHACGYGGEQVDKMGRISGLDPAGPYFTGTPDFVHLNPSDAMFVDVIHTDGDPIYVLGFGTAEPMGNIDFYPNSGLSQPGCSPSSVIKDIILNNVDIVDGARDLFACSHLRSIDYFRESMNNPSCQWIGQECQSYDSYEAGECYSCGDDGSHCAYLGMRADEYVKKSRDYAIFYLDTDKKSPFCMQQYEASILTAHPKEAEDWVIGRLYMTAYGDNSQILSKVQITSDQQKIEHGQILKTLFTSHTDIGHAIRIELKWVYDDEFLHPGTYCVSPFCNRSLYVQSVELNPITHYPESVRQSYETLACSQDGSTTRIKDKSTQSFMANNDCQAVSK